MLRSTALAIFLAIGLAGCASQPMTPQAYRDVMRGHKMGKVETFEVERSVAAVGESFQRKAEECLNYEIISSGIENGARFSKKSMQTKATVIRSADRAELHFQIEIIGNPYDEPPGGGYFLVADATPLGKAKTRVEMYRFNAAVVASALRAWAKGNERGCPDGNRVMETEL